MSENCIVQINMTKEYREYLKEAARKDDSSLSRFIRLKMQWNAEKVLGKEFKGSVR